MYRITAIALAALLMTATLPAAAIGGVAGAGPQESSQSMAADGDAYAGTHVAFETSNTAVTNYSVGGEAVFENVSVDSQSDHESETGIGSSSGLSAVTNVSGLGLTIDAQTETRVKIASEGSASMSAHDTERGILTVDAGSESQYVEATLAEGANATAESDGNAVVVESENRSGAFVIAGDGEVDVNDEGDVTAELGSNSTLVFRSYDEGERDEAAKEQERLIANGTATAEVYADHRDGERVADVATYGEDIAVETKAESEERLEMTAERAQREGTVIIATVSETAIDGAESADDLEVTVDGEAAAEASSYSELEGAIGGDQSRYMVTQSGEADASADVLIAVNHFSERDVAVQPASADGGALGDSVPGFGVGVSVVTLVSAAAARVRS
ncbi:hypothetical protein HALLA_16615 [Halostagnicola larsenii XH-48]|uniref:PGF-CTERM sorting domain-containing protein n=1 Tax=Halostagnicola larsenii XH-48 TaxID=797299 RepID=W0JN90_9EURY|nr:hypothetical protein [Halostagnicola larsenii]AHG00181.1 hypothetical protein HALLA_16615 [Halostagnicola larsenii XH-48]